MTRRKWLRLGLGAAASGGLYARVVEPNLLQLTHTRIRVAGLKDTVRLVQLSDLHSSPEVPTSLLEEAVDLAIGAKPDLICLTGDYITGPDHYDAAGLVRVFARLAKAAPVYSILGNHDLNRPANGAKVRFWSSDGIAALLREGGTTLLNNSNEVFECRGAAFTIAGVADLWRPDFNPRKAFEGVGEELPVVFLCHNPDGKDATADYRWDLMLSGHTHGGQVMVPFVDPTWLPVVDKRFVAGRYDWEGRQLFITRGVGSIRGVRLGCPPEVSLIELHG